MRLPGFPSCKDVFEHRYELDELGPFKKTMLKVHMTMCKNCQRFQETMANIEGQMKETLVNKASKANESQIKELKEEIKSRLK